MRPPEEVVADKGNHGGKTLVGLDEIAVRSCKT